MIHNFDLKVYYEDTDFSGAVYHANYFKFLERARSKAVDFAGIDQIKLKSNGSTFVVRSLFADFLRPTYFGDNLTIFTEFSKVGWASIKLEQKIFKENEFVFSANVKIGLIMNGQAMRFPSEMKQKLMWLV